MLRRLGIGSAFVFFFSTTAFCGLETKELRQAKILDTFKAGLEPIALEEIVSSLSVDDLPQVISKENPDWALAFQQMVEFHNSFSAWRAQPSSAATIEETQEILEQNLRMLFNVRPEWSIDFADELETLATLKPPEDVFFQQKDLAVGFLKYADEVNQNLILWQANHKANRERLKKNISAGLVSRNQNSVDFKILSGFEDHNATQLYEAVQASLQEHEESANEQFKIEQAEAVQSALKKLKDIAQQKILNPPSERDVKGLASSGPDEILRHALNDSQIQFPSKSDENGMSYDELDTLVRGEFTSIGSAFISRIVVPGFNPSICLIDVNYVDHSSKHMLMYLARQVVRAGRGTGRPVVAVLYDKNQPAPKQYRALYFAQPKAWTAARFSNFWRAAMSPRTKSDALFSVLYVSTVMTLGYGATYLKNKHMLDIGLNPGPMPGTEGLLPFLKANFLPLKSHMFFSALIGFFHPVYRFIIYHAPKGKEWQISLKHFFLISFPAGLMTSYYINGFEGINPVTLAGLYELARVALNSIWTNYARPVAYAVPTARMNHRLNTKVWNIGGGFSIKRQQVEFETTYVLLFALKFAQLIQAPGGSLAYFSAPFVAFVISMIYFKTHGHEFNYQEDISKLKRSFMMPVKMLAVDPAKYVCAKTLQLFRRDKKS